MTTSTALATELYRLMDKYFVNCLCHSRDDCSHDIFHYDEHNKNLRSAVMKALHQFEQEAELRYWKEKCLWVEPPFHFKSDGIQYTDEEEQAFEETGKCIE